MTEQRDEESIELKEVKDGGKHMSGHLRQEGC